MIELSQRIGRIPASPTVAFTSLIARLRNEGQEILDLAVGEPDSETPTEIIAATREALARGQTRYGPVAGLPQLRERIAHHLGLEREHIIITNGSKHALYAIFQSILNPGDEVILPSPSWVSFAEQVRLAGARPVFVPTPGHQLDPETVEAAVTRHTRAILVNSPNNPTGAVYPPETIRAVSRLAAEQGLFLVADEAYDAFIYDGLDGGGVLDPAEGPERVIVVRSFSKSHAMTGFRVGYAVAHPAVVQALSRHQSHATGNVCTFAQHGALAALSLAPGYLERQRQRFQAKRDLAFDLASRLFDCIRPQGAFYLFPDVSRHLKQGETAAGFAADLLRRTGVAVVPGEAFGMAGHVRISYGVDPETLKKGFAKLAEAL